jgi:outer membrane receptor for ferrienterochelin and colicins
MEFSPWWSLQNVQFRVQSLAGIELSFGIKNLLNWTPNAGNPFLIARSEDPFDKHVEYDTNGQILATSQNPYALSFDPSYVFAPNQGRRVFIGFKFEF